MTSHNNYGKGIDAESVLPAEIDHVAIVRDVIAMIAAALLPIAMFLCPPACAMLLPHHTLFRAALYLPRTLVGVFQALWPMLLDDALPGRFRLLAVVLVPLARLSTLLLPFMSLVAVALISALAAIRGNRNSET